MAKKLNAVLGIDIGSQHIKVCEIRSQGKEPVITALGMTDTPEGAVDHTGVYNADAVGVALKQCIAASGASISQAVVSIAGQASVLVRTLEVPRMNPDELKDHMQWEINRNIPFAESTVVSDFKKLPDDDPGSPNMDVVMAIAPQSAVDTMMACIKKAGRSLAAIDVEPLSMSRSIQKSYEDELGTQTICMVDMGAKTTSINIFRGSKLLMPRQIPIGGEMFTKAVSDLLSIPFHEAEQLKIAKGEVPDGAAAAAASVNPFGYGDTGGSDFQPYNPFTDDPMPFQAPDVLTGVEQSPFALPSEETQTLSVPSFQGDKEGANPGAMVPAMVGDPEVLRLFSAMQPIVEEFSSEVRRSIDYYRSRGGDVNKIVLCGGGTKLKGLAAYLGEVLGVPCNNYDPLRRLTLNARKVAPEFVEEHRQEFAVAVGNGLHIFFD